MGLSFFDFLTVRPTFYGMIAEEVHRGGHTGWASERLGLIDRYRRVPFFGMQLNPTVFSLIVQGFAIATMYHVVRRKWIDVSWHPLSRRFALVFVGGLMVLLTGSLWPLLADREAHAELMARLYSTGAEGVFTLLIGLFAVVSTLTLLLTVSLITPNRHTTRKGLRRAWKRELTRPPWWWDAAGSGRVTLMLLLIVGLGGAVLLWAVQSGGIYRISDRLWPWLGALVGLLVTVVVAYQGAYERFGQRAVILGLFVVWVVPVMIMVIMLVAFEDLWRTAMTVGGLCPAVAGAFVLAEVLNVLTGHVGHTADMVLGDTAAVEHARSVVVFTVCLYVVLAGLMQVLRVRHARRLRRQEYAKAESAHPPPPPPPATS